MIKLRDLLYNISGMMCSFKTFSYFSLHSIIGSEKVHILNFTDFYSKGKTSFDLTASIMEHGI